MKTQVAGAGDDGSCACERVLRRETRCLARLVLPEPGMPAMPIKRRSDGDFSM